MARWSLLVVLAFFGHGCMPAEHDMHPVHMTTAMPMDGMDTMDHGGHEMNTMTQEMNHEMNTMDHGGHEMNTMAQGMNHEMNTMDHGGHEMNTMAQGMNHEVNTMDHGGHEMNTMAQGMNHEMNTMNHGGHEMNTMNHEDHGDHTADSGDGGHGGHGDSGGHSPYYFFSVDSIILFKDWVTSSWQSMLGSCFGIAALAAAYEGFKLFREHLKVSATKSAEKYNLDSFNKSTSSSSPVCMHLIQVILHMIQVALSYSLMMVFMTFNVWLCLALVIGAGIGYLIFGWKMTHATDMLEHCN